MESITYPLDQEGLSIEGEWTPHKQRTSTSPGEGPVFELTAVRAVGENPDITRHLTSDQVEGLERRVFFALLEKGEEARTELALAAAENQRGELHG